MLIHSSPYNSLKLLGFVLLWGAVVTGWPQSNTGSAQADSIEAVDSAKSIKPSRLRTLDDSILVDIRSKVRTVVAWPFEYVIQPVFGILLFPLRPPLDYILEENLVERGVDLVTFGEQRSAMLYPTMNLKTGTEGKVGVSYRHRHLFLQKDYAVLNYNYYVNADWDASLRYQKAKLLGTSLLVWGGYRFLQDSDAGFRVPGQEPSFLYADSSWAVHGGISNPIKGNWSWEYSIGMDVNRFNLPSGRDTLLRPGPGFDVFARGMYQEYEVFPLGVAITHNSKDASAAPTKGTLLQLNYQYAYVNDYRGPNTDVLRSNSLSHDFQAVDVTYQHYFLLGKQRYTLSNPEIRSNKRYFTDFNLERTLEMFRPGQLRATLLERKVLVFQFRARQMWEMEDGGAPFIAFSQLGNSLPLRGYGGAFRYDYNVMGISTEYRWPILRLVDGVFFNEYGMYGRSWNDPQWGSLVNSWGFGMQMSKPDLFITRLQFGFHGMQGVQLNLTIRPAY